MFRPLVIVIDPDQDRRQTIQARLARRYRVLIGSEPSEVQQALEEQRPQLLALSLVQHGGSGLDFATRLRTLSGDARLRIVVYGQPASGEASSLAEQRALAARHHADRFLGHEPVVETLIEVVRREVPVEDEEFTRPPAKAFELKVVSARREHSEPPAEADLRGRYDRLWELLSHELLVEVVDDLDDDLDKVSWGELLRARANLDNLRRLLTKKIHLRSPQQGTG